MSERVFLEVIQSDNGTFECTVKGAAGTPVAGHGASVLEAVGNWAIQSRTVIVVCKPPAVLREYTIINEYEDLKFNGPAKRC